MTSVPMSWFAASNAPFGSRRLLGLPLAFVVSMLLFLVVNFGFAILMARTRNAAIKRRGYGVSIIMNVLVIGFISFSVLRPAIAVVVPLAVAVGWYFQWRRMRFCAQCGRMYDPARVLASTGLCPGCGVEVR